MLPRNKGERLSVSSQVHLFYSGSFSNFKPMLWWLPQKKSIITTIIIAPVLLNSFNFIGYALDAIKKGLCIFKRWTRAVWNILFQNNRLRGFISSSNISSGGEVSLVKMNAPSENDCCSVCHDSFNLPCQANCSHWFCGECILKVWQHSSALHPCSCPICRRKITLLLPSDLIREDHDIESERILRDIAKYNRYFGGGAVSFIQRLQDMPLLLRRMVRELMDPQRALFLVHRTRIILCLLLLACYVVSPLDILPEAILGVIGFLDDIFVAGIILFYLARLYRSTLLQQHAG